MNADRVTLVKALQNQLKHVARANNRSLHSIFLLYLQERLLFRISKSPYRGQFILKGGLLLYCLAQLRGRPTRDIDLLAQVARDSPKMESIFREICQIPGGDGVEFPLDQVKLEELPRGNNAVMRIRIPGFLGAMWASVIIDLSFQGAIRPGPLDCDYPVLLEGQECPKLKVYSLESSIAGKFQAMIYYSNYNTRMKDFYDIYTFAGNYSFKGPDLLAALRATFEQRQTPIEQTHSLFTGEFARDASRVQQWQTFLARIGASNLDFAAVVWVITAFLQPLYDCLFRGTDLQARWNPSAAQWE